MSFCHRGTSQTGQAHPEGSSHEWSIPLARKTKQKTKQKNAGKNQKSKWRKRQGDKGFLNRAGGRLHTSTAERNGQGNAYIKKNENLEKLKAIKLLIDQHSLTEEYWSGVSTVSDYFFADRGPRPVARSSSIAW